MDERRVSLQETVDVVPSYVVRVDDVRFAYGTTTVLDGADASVPRGGIYALLGPSGCGKTTLIKCILGLLTPKSGDVTVFGERPGSKNSLVPGPAVGYMPQEDGLFGTFTVEETLMYFAKLAGRNPLVVKAKIKEIIALLELPTSSQLASQLSGGQRKRLSLAAALVNDAPLLVLDEPTVGNDVLLIEKIWKHLVKMTSEQRITVIITTHYIAEARQAHIVAFMRGGKIVCETAPLQLYAQLGVDSLEKAFLKLCKMTTAGNECDEEIETEEDKGTVWRSRLSLPTSRILPELVHTTNVDLRSSRRESFEKLKSETKARLRRKLTRIRAHVWKNFVTEKNHAVLLLIKFVLVLLHLIFYPQIFGRPPRDLKIKVFNGDEGDISRQILSHVDRNVLDWTVASLGDNFDEIDIGEFGSLRFPQNYSRNVENVQIDGDDDDCQYWPQLQLFVDMSDKIFVGEMEREIFDTFKRVRLDLEAKNRSLDYFVISETPFVKSFRGSGQGDVQGELSVSDALSINMILLAIYFVAILVAALQLQIELKDSFLTRSLVAGLTLDEMLASFVVSYLPQVALQAVCLQMIVVFQYSVRISPGQTVQLFVLQMLSGVAGVMHGLLVASATSELLCGVVLLPAYMDVGMMTGGVLSVSALPKALFYFSKLIPISQALLSVRYLVVRQWSGRNVFVLMGYVSLVFGSLAFFAISFFILKRRVKFV